MRTRYLLSFRLLVCLPALVLISSYAWAQTPALSEWTWMGGSSTLASSSGSPGVYGTLGTPAAGNIPGGRDNATSWTDPAGNLWLFGGQDVDANGEGVLFNDLWKFNPSTNEWVWMSGRSTVTCSPSSFCGQPGVYGTLDTPAAGNVPGGRWSTSSWIDTSGHLWLYGGYGLDANGSSTHPRTYGPGWVEAARPLWAAKAKPQCMELREHLPQETTLADAGTLPHGPIAAAISGYLGVTVITR